LLGLVSSVAAQDVCEEIFVVTGETITLTSANTYGSGYYYEWVIEKWVDPNWVDLSPLEYTALGLDAADLSSSEISFTSTSTRYRATLTIGSTQTSSTACMSDDCTIVTPTDFTCNICPADWCITDIATSGDCDDTHPLPVSLSYCLPEDSDLTPQWRIDGPGIGAYEVLEGTVTQDTSTPGIICYTIAIDWLHYADFDTNGHGVGIYALTLVLLDDTGAVFSTCSDSADVELIAVPTASITAGVS
jgi:hypothetical protein